MRSVQVDDETTPFAMGDAGLTIDLGKKRAPGDSMKVRVEYLDQAHDESRKMRNRLEKLKAIIKACFPKEGPVETLLGRTPRG